MASVLWSDQNEIIVYRSLKDFEKMHKRLKKAFPGSKKSDRIIPKFQEKMVKLCCPKKGPLKSVKCLKFLQKYCNELLSCDPRVSQHADLFQFLHPNDQDLEPEFTKNSIMIMPTDNEIRNAVQGGGGIVTQPFVTETYRCVALYETKDTKNKPFKVALDEKVEVLIKDKAGWWLVENEDKRIAWFPAPYLEKLHEDDDEEDEDEKDGASERGG
ncbi:NADPH oxidase organizer 1-like [Sebastes umbrosus]|uniref:NADPH oxidase organizer 1-like n=1 Tax=Sebastes umbrosus TaxID=72105 RepID=UPI00189E510A|nr:NADPH oxidase organizer 1-like [Sebastes umbrosus]